MPTRTKAHMNASYHLTNQAEAMDTTTAYRSARILVPHMRQCVLILNSRPFTPIIYSIPTKCLWSRSSAGETKSLPFQRTLFSRTCASGDVFCFHMKRTRQLTNSMIDLSCALHRTAHQRHRDRRLRVSGGTSSRFLYRHRDLKVEQRVLSSLEGSNGQMMDD